MHRNVYRLALTALALLAQLFSATADTVTLQLKWKHQFQFAGYYAAIEQGYYRAAGLEVTLLEGGPHADFAQQLATNAVQYSVALPSMLIRRNEGAPVVALAAICQHSPEVMLVREDSGINNPQQMAGRRLMMSADDTPSLLAMFKNEGMPANAVKIIPYDFNLDRLARGEVDGIGAYITDEPLYFKHHGVAVRAIRPLNYGVDFYGDCLFTSNQELARHPERVKAFLDASLKGWQYAMHHVDETIDLIATKYHSEKSRDDLRFEADEMAKLMFTDLIEAGHMNAGRWRHIADTYVRLGMLKPGYTLSGFMYERNPPRDLGWVWWAIGGASVFMLGLAGVVVFQASVNRRIAGAERQARESQAILQAVLDTIPVGVFWKDRQSVYLGCNRIFSDFAGIASPDRIRGMKEADLPRGQENAARLHMEEQILAQGTAMPPYEESLTAPGGSPRYYQRWKLPLRDGAGQILGVLGICQDISAQKEGELQRIELAERIQEAKRHESVQRLIGGISHNFNNILHAVIGYTNLTENFLPPEHAAREHLAQVVAQSRRAAKLNQVLQVTIGYGKYDLQPVEFDTAIDIAQRFVSPLLPSHHWFRYVPGAPGIKIRADQESLGQILLNLATNSSEAIGDASGEIVIQTGTLHCDRAYLKDPHVETRLAEGEYAYFDLIDRGGGMTPKTLKHLFDPFFSTKFQGRGLGLATVLGMVRCHYGAVRIHSVEGTGTTVRVLFPVSGKS